MVPEAMAYAGIAGVPPLVGLYTVPLPLIAYALFGTSRTMVVGPDSATALISYTVVGALAARGAAEYVVLTSGLALLVGAFFLLFGLLRFGWVANFISIPVMRGFIQGLMWMTIIGQVPTLLAVEAGHGNFFAKVSAIVQQWQQVNWTTASVGLGSIALLFVFKRLSPKFPAALTTAAIAIVVSTVFDLQLRGVAIVGDSEAGLLSFGFPQLSLTDARALIPGALSIVLLGYAESLASAKAVTRMSGGQINPNQELISLGVANLGSAVSGGFVAVGSLSKTSVAMSAGAKTQITSLINAVLVVLTLIFLMPLFSNLPHATLAAVVIEAMLGLADFGYLKRLFGISRSEFLVAMTALLGVMVLGVLQGIGLGMGLAVLSLTFKSSFPAMSVLGKLPGEEIYRDITRRHDAQTLPGLLMVRFEASPFFANAPQFEAMLIGLVKETQTPVKAILIDAENINSIDSTAMEMLTALNAELVSKQVVLYFAHIKDPVWDAMRRAGVEDAVGQDHFFESMGDAVKAFCQAQREQGIDCELK
jgi:SulP family sulfate permease